MARILDAAAVDVIASHQNAVRNFSCLVYSSSSSSKFFKLALFRFFVVLFSASSSFLIFVLPFYSSFFIFSSLFFYLCLVLFFLITSSLMSCRLVSKITRGGATGKTHSMGGHRVPLLLRLSQIRFRVACPSYQFDVLLVTYLFSKICIYISSNVCLL